jgi:hypothetical protein
MTADEMKDSARWEQVRVAPAGHRIPKVSWLWPASFFVSRAAGEPPRAAAAGQALHVLYDGVGSELHHDWYESDCFHAEPLEGWPEVLPLDLVLRRGDVVIFGGGHSVIATGRRFTRGGLDHDEVSQMWWSRAEQAHVLAYGEPSPENDPEIFYDVTRDSILDLMLRFGNDRTAFGRPAVRYRLNPSLGHLANFSPL